MPTATIQTPSGQIVRLEVPEGATEQQILQFVESQDLSQFTQGGQDALRTPDTLPDVMDSVEPVEAFTPSGTAQAAGTILSSAIAEPIAGLAGLLSAPFVGVDGAVENIDAVREALTFIPDDPEGQKTIQSISEFVRPVGEAVSSVESGLGESVLDVTGSPELAAVAHSLPTAFIEAIGLKGLRSTKRLNNVNLSPNVANAIQQAAPDLDTIKAAKNAAYRELDGLGIRVKPQVYENFANNLSTKLAKEGIDPALHPKSSAALNRILADVGQSKSPSELETLRKIAKGAAQSIDKPDARLGTIIVDELDKGLDQLSGQIGGKFKEARGLAQRAFKSQAIQDMIENASHTASGIENGLRIEARKILRNPKKRRGFTADELDALKRIEQGTTAANTAKFLGKFGISEGQATSMLGASIGAGGGGAIGATFGGPAGGAVGALTVPALGQIAKRTAQRITLDNTKFADDLARSGKNAKAIARTYLKHTPRAERRVSDLTDLFLQEGVDIDAIKSLPKSMDASARLIADAKFFAQEVKRRAKQATGAAVLASPAFIPEEAEQE